MRGTKFAFLTGFESRGASVPVARRGGLRICCGLPTPLPSGSRCWISAHFILQSSRRMLPMASIFLDLSMIFRCCGHLGILITYYFRCGHASRCLFFFRISSFISVQFFEESSYCCLKIPPKRISRRRGSGMFLWKSCQGGTASAVSRSFAFIQVLQ